MKNLILFLSELEDPRDKRGLKHELTNIIVMCIYAILCGCTDCESIAYFLELKKEYFINLLNLDKKYGVPSADTLLRVFAIIDAHKFMEIFSEWINGIIKEKASTQNIKGIAIDGKAVKAVKAATDKINGGNIPYVVSAYLTDIGVSIGQVKVEDKTNEITAIPELLELIDITDCIITIDAIGTQTKIINKILSKKGNYCLPLKTNQKQAYEDVKEYFEYVENTRLEKDKLDTNTVIDKGHGRIEKRETYVITDFDKLDALNKFKGVNSIIKTENYREITGQTSIQEKYYISNLKLSAKKFGDITRKHWQIENNLHWTLDVYFKEDLSTAKKSNAIHNFSLLRKICFNLIKLDDSIKRKEINKRMMYYNHDLDNLKRLIFEIYPNTNQI